jgi:hypothetical protein
MFKSKRQKRKGDKNKNKKDSFCLKIWVNSPSVNFTKFYIHFSLKKKKDSTESWIQYLKIKALVLLVRPES